jgi:hypothetical protein
MAKTKIDPVEMLRQIQEEENQLFKDFEAKMRVEREKKLAAVIDPLKKERTELSMLVNDSNTRISEIDKELGKLTGVQPKPAKASGKRNRLSGEAREQEKAAVKAAGNSIFKALKKHGTKKQVPVADLKEAGLGYPVKVSLQPWIDAGFVKFHPNGPKPLYEFIEDGDLPEAK